MKKDNKSGKFAESKFELASGTQYPVSRKSARGTLRATLKHKFEHKFAKRTINLGVGRTAYCLEYV